MSTERMVYYVRSQGFFAVHPTYRRDVAEADRSAVAERWPMRLPGVLSDHEDVFRATYPNEPIRDA